MKSSFTSSLSVIFSVSNLRSLTFLSYQPLCPADASRIQVEKQFAQFVTAQLSATKIVKEL